LEEYNHEEEEEDTIIVHCCRCHFVYLRGMLGVALKGDYEH
jgi:hypothetical protein